MDAIKNVTIIEPFRVKKDYSVGIYARVSTNNREQLNSLSEQISGLTRLAAHMTWFVADVFIDIGTAKTGSTRKEFERLISACEHNAIDIVLTKSISRFGRDSLDTLEAIRRIKAAGKRIMRYLMKKRIENYITSKRICCISSLNEVLYHRLSMIKACMT